MKWRDYLSDPINRSSTSRKVLRDYHRLNVSPDLCIYCGDPAEAWDHAVPVRWSNTVDVSSEDLVTVPACADCNGALGGKVFSSIQYRADWLRARLERQLAKLGPDWAEDELAELGPTLRGRVAELQLKRRRLQERIKNLANFVEYW